MSDVLVAPWTLRSALLTPAVVRARLAGVGTVLWGHGYSKQERPQKLRWRERQGQRADALGAASSALNDAIKADDAVASAVKRGHSTKSELEAMRGGKTAEGAKSELVD